MSKSSSGKKRRAALILGISLVAFAACIALPSLAWFVTPETSQTLGDGITGEAKGSYFEGEGTESSPYLIDNPKRLYYFNWLQDLGYFNKDNDGDGIIETIYIKISDDLKGQELDMKDYVLPPAGTSDFPFVGNFNGNDCAIKNLTITNSWDNLTKRPGTAIQDESKGILSGAEIVGFFGIIGQYATDVSYDSSTNAVNNLYFDNLTVESAATNVLAGFIAGYANGQINNCGIHTGQFSLVAGASPLSDGTLKESNLSNYALIGDYNKDNFAWDNKPEGSGGDGTGNNWGGSINIYSLNRRINYITAQSSMSSKVVSNADYNAYWKFSSNGELLQTENMFCYIRDNTIIPLNVNTDENDESSVFYGGEVAGTTNTSWKTTNYYKTHSSEDDAILSTNSGYIVGGNSASKNNGDLVTTMSPVKSKLSNSGANSPYDGTLTTYTIDTSKSGNTTSEKVDVSNYNSSFGYTRYKDVREQFDASMNGLTYVHGFHIYQIIGFSSSWSEYTTTGKAIINGKTYSSYQFMESSLNFTLSHAGYITVLAGSYYSRSAKQSLFDLYKVERDSNGSIQSLIKISKIYGTRGGGKYYYDDTSSSSNLLFDFSSITTTGVMDLNKAYYFEIPVNAGDYVIGNESYNNTAYLMYLDIGANADSSSSSGETKIEKSNIDFVYEESSTLAKITDDGYTPSGVVFSVGKSPTSTSLIYFERRSKENAGESVVGVLYYTASGCEITPIGSGKSTNEDPTKQQA